MTECATSHPAALYSLLACQWVWGLGFRVEGLGFRVEGLGLRVYGFLGVTDARPL